MHFVAWSSLRSDLLVKSRSSHREFIFCLRRNYCVYCFTCISLLCFHFKSSLSGAMKAMISVMMLWWSLWFIVSSQPQLCSFHTAHATAMLTITNHSRSQLQEHVVTITVAGSLLQGSLLQEHVVRITVRELQECTLRHLLRRFRERCVRTFNLSLNLQITRW